MATKKATSTNMSTPIIVLLAIVLLLQLWTLFGGGVKNQIMEVEALKVGGQANWEDLVDLYQTEEFAEFQEASIEGLEKTIENPTAAADPAPTPTPTPTPAPAPAPAPTTKLAASDLEALKDDLPVKGSADAKIMIIEYSDAECPFCQRHYDAKTLDTVSEKYGDDVALSFRHYPLSFHAKAGPAAEAMECAKVVGGDEAFFAVEDAIFISKNLSDAGYKAAATEAGVDMAAWQSCIDNGDTKAEVAAQMSEGQSKFGVRGTPGNVVVNMETGEFELVSGAQQAGAFDAVIARMLGN